MVGKKLGVTGIESTIGAELYKMLLYEEGAFVDRHREYVVFRETFRKALRDLIARRRPRACSVPRRSRYLPVIMVGKLKQPLTVHKLYSRLRQSPILAIRT